MSNKPVIQTFNPIKKEHTTVSKIIQVTDSLSSLLIEKNKRYGNSALEPINTFSKLNSENSIAVRLDDKLSRIKNSEELRKNDIVDMLGYLTLLCVSKDWLNFDDLID